MFTSLIQLRVALLALLGAGMLVPAFGQPAHPQPGTEALRRVVSTELELWLSAVRQHSPGRADHPAELIASWSRRDLESIVREAKPLPFLDAPLLKRAAVLHTDIAVLNRTSEGYSLPGDDRSLDFISDGAFVEKRAGTFHWRIARQLLDLAEPDDDILLWYTATSAVLQSWREYSELPEHLKRARARFPRAGALALYEGTLHATYSGSRVQNWIETAAPPRGRDPRPIGDAAAELREAEDWFRRALRLDATLVEARVRLGWVCGLRGRHEEAAAELRRVTLGDLGRQMQYFAWLLLGREEAALGERDAAERAFGRAASLYPEAQSPRLGLSLLAHGDGDRAASRQALDLLSDTEMKEDDPWWTFNSRHEPDAEELLAEMRRRLAP